MNKIFIKVFGNKLGIWHSSCKIETEIVYAMDVPIEQIIEVDVSTSQNSSEEESPFVHANVDKGSSAYKVFHVANTIRGEIQNMKSLQ